MAIDNECVDYARECVRLAVISHHPEVRDKLMATARQWMAQAIGENQVPVPDKSETDALRVIGAS